MNSIKKAALALTLTSIGFAAKAQKSVNEGVINYSITAAGQQTDVKNYFKGDSSSYQMQQGPADIKVNSNQKGDYLVILIDVPVASMKKAAVATPADIEQMKDQEPNYTFTPTSETQTISGYSCKKVQAKDSKLGSNFDVWVTNDITTPNNSLTKYFSNAGGYPIKFTTMQRGQQVQVLLKSVTAEKVKPGTFGIPAGFEKISMDDLKALSGGRG